MIPIYLKLENYRCFELAEIDFSKFSVGIVCGLNGAGKSSLFESFEFVLYGECSGKIESVIREGTNLCSVEFQFLANDGNTYKVLRKRFRRGNRGEVFLWIQDGEEWKDLTEQRSGEVDVELRKILGVGHKTFKSIVLCSQREKERKDLTISEKRDGSDRREILKEAVELSEYSVLAKFIQEKFVREIKDRIEKLTSESDSLNKSVNDSLKLKNEEKQLKVEIEKSSAKLVELQKNQQINKEKLIGLESLPANNLEQLKANWQVEQRKTSELKAELENIRTKVNARAKKGNESGVTLTNLKKEIEKLTKEQETLTFNLSGFDKKSIAERIEDSTKEQIAIQSQILTLTSEKKKLELPFPEDEVCPHCRSIPSSEHREKCLKEIPEKLAEVKNQILKLNSDLEKINAEQNRLNKELKDKEKLEKELFQTKTKLESSQKEYKEKLMQSVELASEYDILLTEFQTKKINFETQEKLEKIKEAEYQQALASDVRDAIAKLKKEVDRFEKEIHSIQQDILSHNQELGKLAHQIAICEENKLKIQDIEKWLAESRKELWAKELAIKACKEVPGMAINFCLDDLQHHLNQELQQIAPEIECSLIVDRPKDGSEATWKDLEVYADGQKKEPSVGQGFKLSLAMREAYEQALSKRLGIHLGLRLYDEVDAYLDEPGRQALAQLLKRLSSNRKVLIITHHNEIQEKFPTRLYISKQSNGHTLEVLN